MAPDFGLRFLLQRLRVDLRASLRRARDPGAGGRHRGPDLGTLRALVVDEDQPAADERHVSGLAEGTGKSEVRVAGRHALTAPWPASASSGSSGRDVS